MVRETSQAPAGNTLVKHPDDIPPQTMWHKTTVLTLAAGQPRPYADSRYEYEVTFEGGSPSTRDGWDLPSGTMPPRTASSMGSTETKLRYEERVKDKIKANISHPWQAEKDDRKFGQSYLESLTVKETEDTHTTYRVVVVSEYMD